MMSLAAAGLLAIQRAGAQEEARKPAALSVESKLDRLLAAQDEIMKRLDAIEEELRIVKVRCTR